MKNNFEGKIKKNLTVNNFNISQKHLSETIKKAKEEYLRTKSKSRIGFFDFLKLQIKYIGTYTWLIQGGFMFFVYTFLKMILQDKSEFLAVDKVIVIFLINISLITALGNMMYLVYSKKNNMLELENSTYMSSSKIFLSRFIILGIGNLIIFTSILVQLANKTNMTVYFGIIMLVFPYLLVSCGNNLLINIRRKINNNIFIIYNFIIFILLNILMYSVTNYNFTIKVLSFSTIILIVIYIFQIKNIYCGNFNTEEIV